MPATVNYGGPGRAFGELLAIVKDVRAAIAAFHAPLEKLESTLTRIEPVVKDIDKFNKELDRPKDDLSRIEDLMMRGSGLVKKCQDIHKYSWFKKHSHSKKLSHLDESISREFQIFFQLMNARDGREILYEVKRLSEDVHRGMLCRQVEVGAGVGVGVGIGVPLGACGRFAVPEEPDFVVGSGMEESMKKLKNQLLEKGISVIVVTAPGGCGKTTLVNKLCHDADIEGKFSSIFFVPFSKSPNMMDIVQKMFQHLAIEAPQIENDDDAVHALLKLLKMIGEHPVLLVLDDVGPGSESILEKFIIESIPDYKIVVTSRYEFPAFGPPHRLKPLCDEEAMELFCRCAGIKDKRKGIPDDELVEKIVSKCKGLPLALTAVAKSLQGRHPIYWERWLLDWSEGQSILDSDSDVRNCLKSGSDNLDSNPSLK